MIEQLIIENYKSMHSVKIPMKNLNVLIGSNGVGKSNFISFFELIQKMYAQSLNSYIMMQGGIERFLYQGSKCSDCIKALIDFKNTNAFFFELKPTIENKVFIEYSGDYQNNNGDNSKRYEENWNQTIWDRTVSESDIRNNKKWKAEYLERFLNGLTVYHFHDSSKNAPMRKSCAIDDNESLKHDAANL